jgi:hypothetical protein
MHLWLYCPVRELYTCPKRVARGKKPDFTGLCETAGREDGPYRPIEYLLLGPRGHGPRYLGVTPGKYAGKQNLRKPRSGSSSSSGAPSGYGTIAKNTSSQRPQPPSVTQAVQWFALLNWTLNGGVWQLQVTLNPGIPETVALTAMGEFEL